MFNWIRLLYLNVCVWIASKLTTLAAAIFSRTVGLAMKWDIKAGGKSTADVAKKVDAPRALEITERPSTRHRRLRREQAAVEAQKVAEAPVEAAVEVPKSRQALAPEVNPFSAGGVDGQVPMCMDPLPNFVVFEAMFNKKYGRNGRCPLSVMGTAHAYTAFELYTLLTKIAADGEKAGPVYNALYGTVFSVIINQHGRKLESKELN